jgi:hypothetical protein
VRCDPVIGPTVAQRAAKSQPTGTNEANYRQRSVAYPLELRCGGERRVCVRGIQGTALRA